MEKRVRSPNYPAFGLSEAIQRAALVYKNQHTHGAPREVVAKSMGYNSLNGASATAISALIKYGLLEGRADEIRISDRAMRILHPETQAEKAGAIREAGNEPALFRELSEKFPGHLPSEEILRNHLIRMGFASNATSSVILAYRETKEFVDREGGYYDSAVSEAPEEAEFMTESNPGYHRQARNYGDNQPKTAINERALARYEFEGGGTLVIAVQGNVDTEQALEMAETLIGIKRKELNSRNASRETVVKEPENEGENDNEQNACFDVTSWRTPCE